MYCFKIRPGCLVNGVVWRLLQAESAGTPHNHTGCWGTSRRTHSENIRGRLYKKMCLQSEMVLLTNSVVETKQDFFAGAG